MAPAAPGAMTSGQQPLIETDFFVIADCALLVRRFRRAGLELRERFQRVARVHHRQARAHVNGHSSVSLISSFVAPCSTQP